jgi:hypothetical protein
MCLSWFTKFVRSILPLGPLGIIVTPEPYANTLVRSWSGEEANECARATASEIVPSFYHLNQGNITEFLPRNNLLSDGIKALVAGLILCGCQA